MVPIANNKLVLTDCWSSLTERCDDALSTSSFSSLFEDEHSNDDDSDLVQIKSHGLRATRPSNFEASGASLKSSLAASQNSFRLTL